MMSNGCSKLLHYSRSGWRGLGLTMSHHVFLFFFGSHLFFRCGRMISLGLVGFQELLRRCAIGLTVECGEQVLFIPTVILSFMGLWRVYSRPGAVHI